MSISALSSSQNYNPIHHKLQSIEDSNGNISKDSFVKNRPSGISETDASSLFDKIDSGKTGSLTESQLTAGLQQYGPQASSGNSSDSSSSDSGLTGQGGLASLLDPSILASLLQSQNTNSNSTTSSSSNSNDPFSSLEGSDGKISRDSFVKNRPPGVSASDAGSLFDSIDQNKTGELTSSQLQSGLKSQFAAGDSGNSSDTTSSADSTDSTDSTDSASGTKKKHNFNAIATLLKALEAVSAQSTSSTSSSSTASNDPLKALEGSDGKISRDSFVKNRPPGVSADQAGNLFDSIDTDKSGSLTSSQLQDGLQTNSTNLADYLFNSSGSDSTSSSSNQQTSSLDDLLKAIKGYSSSSNYSNVSADLLSKLYATA